MDLGLPSLQQLLDVLVVLLSEYTCAFFPFEDQVVACGDVVEFVALNIIFGLFPFNLMVFFKYSHNFLIDWNYLLADKDRRSVWGLVFDLSKPGVPADVFDSVARLGLRVENEIEQVLALSAEE